MIGKSLAMVVASVLGMAVTVSAATLYDSHGFESPLYGVGDLAGQDNWTVAALPSSVSVIDFAGGIASDVSGQYVSFPRGLDAQDGVGAWYQPITYTKSLATPIVQTTWSMGISGSDFPGGYFGVELYNSTLNQSVAMVWVDSETGSLMVGVGGNPQLQVVSGVGPLNGTWANYAMTVNFATGKYSVSINGADAGSFDVANIMDSVDYVRLVSWGQYTDPFAPTGSQTTYSLQSYAGVDDLVINTVPEPGIFGALGCVVGLLVRRRRQR